MLDALDLKVKLPKKEYSQVIKVRTERLSELQREIRARNIPVIILFEGWFQAGKGRVINSLAVNALDPRGFKLHTRHDMNAQDFKKLKPFFWKYWLTLPPKGRLSLFDKSWYDEVIHKYLCKDINGEKARVMYDDINDFEHELTADGTVVLKFFLHISKREQRKRVEDYADKLARIFSQQPGDEEVDLKEVHKYESYFNAYEEMFRLTDTEYAPWTAVEANNFRYAEVKVYDVIINQLVRAINKYDEKKAQKKAVTTKNTPDIEDYFNNGLYATSMLNKVDLSKTVPKDVYEIKLKEYQNQLQQLQLVLYVNKIPVVLAFEGWDAGGKGGAIKRITKCLNPRGYYVNPVAAPGMVDRLFHYLWRFWKEFPSKGHIAIFDRSWYGRVLVERVEGFATEEEWRRAYREINEMEKQLTNNDAIVLKFWMQISKDEQEKRFKAREVNPQKKWKITEEDWRNRSKWDQYEVAVNEMLFRTSTKLAPWIIVEGNCKYHARLKVIKTLIDTIEEKLKELEESKTSNN